MWELYLHMYGPDAVVLTLDDIVIPRARPRQEMDGMDGWMENQLPCPVWSNWSFPVPFVCHVLGSYLPPPRKGPII